MTIHVTNISYSEKTREWNVTIDNLAGWKQYSEDPRSDKSVWTFGEFMEMGAELPTELNIDVPYNDVTLYFDEIDAYIRKKIKQLTTREPVSYRINC